MQFPKTRHKTLSEREGRYGWLFISPWLIGIAVFFAFPLLYSIVLAFSEVLDITGYKLRFTGISNFSQAFVSDINFVPKLLASLSNMLLRTPVIIMFSLFISILLNSHIRMKGFFRTMFFLPVLIGSGVVMNLIQGSGVNQSMGMVLEGARQAQNLDVTTITMSEGFSEVLGPFFANLMQSILDQVTKILWLSGIQIIIFLGALQAIPESYYEAARCDGASEWNKFWKITLPLCTPTIFLNIIYTIIDSLTASDNGVIQYTIDIAFANLNLGYGSALGWIYFLMTALVVALVFVVMNKVVFYNSDK